MMHAYRLVRLIETHAAGLANGLQKKIDASDRVPDYHGKVPREELTSVVNEIYQNLGQWLLGKTESDIESRYVKIGMRRAEQGVPQSQVLWVIALVKENLWEYLKQEHVLEKPVEIFGSLEMLELLEQFFDRAMYYASVGYEKSKAVCNS
jgi:hypothetical protein